MIRCCANCRDYKIAKSGARGCQGTGCVMFKVMPLNGEV